MALTGITVIGLQTILCTLLCVPPQLHSLRHLSALYYHNDGVQCTARKLPIDKSQNLSCP